MTKQTASNGSSLGDTVSFMSFHTFVYQSFIT